VRAATWPSAPTSAATSAASSPVATSALLGRPSSILVRGDLANLSIPAGSLYSEIRVGGSISRAVTIGGTVVKPGATCASNGSIIAFGAIKTVAIGGDYNGDIISHSGGIASVAITNGSFLPGRNHRRVRRQHRQPGHHQRQPLRQRPRRLDITLLSVIGGIDGIFGDVGVNPTLSSAVRYDDRRNQLPPGVREAAAVQGPDDLRRSQHRQVRCHRRRRLRDLSSAGRNISAIAITGSVGNDTLATGFGSYFAAGDAITSITVGGSVSKTRFVAGLVDLAPTRPSAARCSTPTR
jgi:hypothetical protein